MPVPEKEAQAIINNKLVQDVANVYYDAETQILGEISNKTYAMLNDDHWANKKYQEVAQMNANIADLLERKQGVSQTKLDNAIVSAYLNGSDAVNVQFGLPRNVLSRMDIPAGVQRLILETNNMISSNTLNALRVGNDAFREIQAQTAFGVVTGLETRKEIAQRMLNQFADRGISVFIDRAGRKWSLGAYTDMATRTVAHRAMIQGHLDRQIELGRDLVQVSNHGSSCPLCGPYQGGIFSISGNDPRYQPLQNAIGGGLFHPNCKHSLTGYIDGLSKVGRSKENKQEYAFTQQQRYNERNIRKWKNREVAALDPATKKAAKDKIGMWQGKQRDLLKNAEENGYNLRRKYDRESVKFGVPKVTKSTWVVDDAFHITPIAKKVPGMPSVTVKPRAIPKPAAKVVKVIPKPIPKVVKPTIKPSIPKPKVNTIPSKEKLKKEYLDSLDVRMDNYFDDMFDNKYTGAKTSVAREQFHSIKYKGFKAEDDAKKMFNLSMKELKVVEKESKGGFYQSYSRKINFDLVNDSSKHARKGKGTVFYHEYGHFIDDVMGKAVNKNAKGKYIGGASKLSNNGKFIKAMNKDLDDFLQLVADQTGYSKDSSRVKSIASTRLKKLPDAGGNMISDTFGGLSQNKVQGRWGHSNSYWNRGNTAAEAASEAFAHMHAATMVPELQEVVAKYMPETLKEYKNIISRTLDKLADKAATTKRANLVRKSR